VSDYRSKETAIKAARWGASGPNKRDTLTKQLLKKGELELKLELKRAKGGPPDEKHHG
jgi:hypothetical protein